jgi:hypothetical protein
LHLFFEQAQGKLDIVMLHLYGEHGITNAAAAGSALAAVSQGLR